MEETQPTINSDVAPENQIKPIKPWLKIALFSVLGVVLIGGLVFAGIQIGKKQTHVISQPIPTPRIITTPTSIVVVTSPSISTANWRIYENEKYGFGFRYPEDLLLCENNDLVGLISAGPYANPEENQCEVAKERGYKISFISSKDDKEFQNYREENYPHSFSNYKATEIKIDNKNAEVVSGIEKETFRTFKLLKIQNGDSFLIIKTEGEGQNIVIFDQILSTFKFLDQPQTDETTSWKTYRNNDLSFRYPPNWSTSGYVITSDLPKINLVVIPSDSSLMNECMSEASTETKNNLVIKKFRRVTTGEMCATSDSTPREIWIMRSPTIYAPGIMYGYSSTEGSQAESIFDQILSTFKFIE